MLRDLTIKNYRCFKDFTIDGLARVNLIVGKNNSGKTALLEAIYLLANQNNPYSLIEVLHSRGERAFQRRRMSSSEFQLSHIFHGHNPQIQDRVNEASVVSFVSRKDQGLSLDLELGFVSRQLSLFESPDELSPAHIMLQMIYQAGTSEANTFRLPITEEFVVTSNQVPGVRERSNHRFVTTHSVGHTYLSQLWDSITLTPKEEEVISALRILEPKIDRISFTGNSGGIIVRMQGQDFPIPLNSMGDGMRRILTLAMSAVTAQNSVVLVDEIDTGLYHGTQTDMWRVLIETAQRLNIQIFATTHSWDCVEAFQEALKQVSHLENGEPLGLLFRIETRNGILRKVKYDARDLEIAVEQDIEVR
jgi:hypothetical protein